MTDVLKFGDFKATIGQVDGSVAVTLYFDSEGHASAYFDWLASQILDSGEVVVRFNAKNVRQVEKPNA